MPSNYARWFCIVLVVGGASKAGPPLGRALDDAYYILKNGSKFIELRCFSDDGGIVHDPDLIPAEVVTGPAHGFLELVGGSTYRYVPNNDYTGPDLLTFRCGSNSLNTATVTIHVVERQFAPDAFIMPHGIAPPPFGMMETPPPRPDPWTQAEEGFYYVDLTNGTDCQPGTKCELQPDWPYGSPANPRKTIPPILNAGDVVEVHGYGEPGPPVDVEALGTPGEPVFIRGDGPYERAFLMNGLRIKGDYVILEYLSFDASAEDPFATTNYTWLDVIERDEQTSTSHVAVRHCGFFNHPHGETVGVAAMRWGATRYLPSSPDNSTTRVTEGVVYDTVVMEFGNWAAQVSGDYSGVMFEANARNMWCLDSVFHHIQGSSLGVSRNNGLPNQTTAENCYMARNVIHHMKEFGVYLKTGLDVIVSQNKIYRIRRSLTSFSGAGVYISNEDICVAGRCATSPDDWYSDNLWVIFNEVYDTQTGISANQQIRCTVDGGCDVECCPPRMEGCDQSDPDYALESETERTGRVYAIGNVLHHIWPFGENPASFGAAVSIGNQIRARVINNTIYNCNRGVHVSCTHSSGECPAGGDPSNPIGVTRNTRVAVVNNIILDPLEDGVHLHTCTGPYPQLPTRPATLAEFHHNLHYPPETLYVSLPNGNVCPSLECLRAYPDQDHNLGYGRNSVEDLDPDLADPPELDFHATAGSDFGQLGLPDDSAYTDFDDSFGALGFPSIYHDYDGRAYNSTTCSFGAFADPDSFAIIIGAGSWRTHGGGVGRESIAINPAGSIALGTVSTEPRAGGITELRLAFDSAPGSPGSPAVTIEERTCGDGGSFSPYSGAAGVTVSVEANELVVLFSPALENLRTYRITLGPEVSSIANQSLEVRVLTGDVAGDGGVNALDRSAVVGVWGGAGYTPASDVDLSGHTDGTDRSRIIAAWTGMENCAP